MSGVRFDSVKDLPEWAQKQLLGKVQKTSLPQSAALTAPSSEGACGFAKPSPSGLRPATSPKGRGKGEERNKYGAQKTEVNGIRFDSKKEARRYEQLMMLLQAGKIRDLKLQHDFTLQEAYTDIYGKRWRAIRFRADFSYEERGEDGTWQKIVEDVKSKATKTRVYAIKKKLRHDVHKVCVREFE